ncbi:MAG: response regulator, partial [Desulfobacteraceae bacterium]|nr:response regulator [Desulfobacteraceae bacterium]
NMSHEIRTPINGIMGMAEIAMGNNLDGNLRRIIKTIDSEAGSLLTIINRILDFSKIEAGKLTLEHIAFDLRNTFEKACSLVTVGMNKKDIEFISFLAPDVPSKLMGDPGRLRQVILNLAGNAMKFTHKGEIFLKAEVIKYYKTEVEIRFIVKDTGIGIEEAKQKTIFDSFNQADGSTTRKYGGTGLGTTIAKQLVELMGGKIGFESEVGKGTTFWFSIKFEKQKGKAVQPAERSINLNGLKILVIDDNETNRFVLAEYLKAFGIQPIVVENEKAGIETIELSFKDKKPVDSVIIDLEHSDIGVFEFAKKIRQNKNFAKLPIILLASSGEIGDGKICKDIGIDAYLLKPVKQDELKRAIGKALYNFSFEKKDQQLITRHTIAEESYKDLHVLVVEDYATNQQIASKHLTGAGYKVTIAKNGKIAVDLFKKQDFDLIMMDIQMPVMDGYQATKLIREYELKISNSNINDSDNFNKKNKIPIIAMTAHAIVGYREKCLKAGMDDYISKPLRREKFLGIVGKWVSKNKSFLDDGRTGDAEGSQDYGNYLAHAYDIPMDFELALNELEGDKEFLLDILHEFLFNVESQLVLIKTALQNNDSKTVQKESHSIKGGAANLTAYSLSKIAHELEDIGASKNLENGLKVCENLEKALSTLKSFIAKSYI